VSKHASACDATLRKKSSRFFRRIRNVLSVNEIKRHNSGIKLRRITISRYTRVNCNLRASSAQYVPPRMEFRRARSVHSNNSELPRHKLPSLRVVSPRLAATWPFIIELLQAHKHAARNFPLVHIFHAHAEPRISSRNSFGISH